MHSQIIEAEKKLKAEKRKLIKHQETCTSLGCLVCRRLGKKVSHATTQLCANKLIFGGA